MKVPENASLQQSVKDFYLFLLQKCSRKFAICSTDSSSSQHSVSLKKISQLPPEKPPEAPFFSLTLGIPLFVTPNLFLCNQPPGTPHSLKLASPKKHLSPETCYVFLSFPPSTLKLSILLCSSPWKSLTPCSL